MFLCCRRSKAASPTSSSSASSERTRTLKVTRDEQTGYGLTLSGDRPVSVQTVRPGGAAHAAGVREKDVIVKVNGAHVTHSTHTEVVDLISGKQQ
jgi:Rho guanine nucleotide exchange factor 11